MGLDVFAVDPKEKPLSKEILDEFKKIDLMRGIVMGYVPNSFRGRYDKWIESVTGVSHYAAEIFPTIIVEEMYKLLKKEVMSDREPVLPKEDKFDIKNRKMDAEKVYPKEITNEEKENIVLFFHLVVKHKLCLHNDF